MPRSRAHGERHRAPEQRVADHEVDRRERQVEVALDEHAPVRLADGRDRREDRAAARLLRPGQPRREPHEVRRRASRRARGSCAPGENGKRIAPCAVHAASPAPRGAPRPGTPARIGCQETSASTTPRRLASGVARPGSARTATGPERRHPERLALVAHAVAAPPRSPCGTRRRPRATRIVRADEAARARRS